MSQRSELASRREKLLLRSTALREKLTYRSQVVQPALGAVDRVSEGASWVRRNPALLALVGAALVGALLARPRSAVNLGLRAWSGWQMIQRVRPLANAVLSRLA